MKDIKEDVKEGLIGYYQITTGFMESSRKEGVFYANRPYLLIFSFLTNGMIIFYFENVWYIWALLIYVNLLFIGGLLSYIGEAIYRERTEDNMPVLRWKEMSEGQEFLVAIYLTVNLVVTAVNELFGVFYAKRPFLLVIFYVANGFVFHYLGDLWYDWILLVAVSMMYGLMVLSYIGEYIHHQNKINTMKE